MSPEEQDQEERKPGRKSPKPRTRRNYPAELASLEAKVALAVQLIQRIPSDIKADMPPDVSIRINTALDVLSG